MSKIIYGNEHIFVPWAQEKIGVQFRRDAYSIGLVKDDEIVATVVYDNFSKNDLCMHIASDGSKRWMSKEFLVSAFSYPFVQLGLPRVTGLVPASNEAALAFDEHLGFVREGYHPKAAQDDGDLISLGLLKEACRFIPKEHDL